MHMSKTASSSAVISWKDGVWIKKKLLMDSARQPPPTYFLLSTSQPGLWGQNRKNVETAHLYII